MPENLRQTTLHRTDIYRNLSLGAPDCLPVTLLNEVVAATSIMQCNILLGNKCLNDVETSITSFLRPPKPRPRGRRPRKLNLNSLLESWRALKIPRVKFTFKDQQTILTAALRRSSFRSLIATKYIINKDFLKLIDIASLLAWQWNFFISTELFWINSESEVSSTASV